ncbi:MAG: FAD-binding oxidoreductase [Myxococcota bacterium]|jgi:glycolate oxidase|nr:FAD-binding oxidoreductase [Myxococcota bacterium]
MEKSDMLLRELQNIVSVEWASDEPELTCAYSRDVNMYPQNLSSVLRPPFYVVLPGTAEEVQKIVALARLHKTPITVQTTGLNVCGICVPPRGGILMDMKRMDKVLEIDEQNMTATIEPYVSIARLSCELQKRGMYLPVPGNPSTASVISNILVGLGLKVTNRVGRQEKGIVGFKMVLPDGSFFKAGSGADPFIPKSFWPHGPGPDLHLLPVHALGTTGIVTEMTVKCWLRGEEYKELWVSYEDIDKAAEAFMDLSRREIAKGLNLYGGNKYTSYATDTREAIERMVRANPEFQLVLSLEGTKRRIEYEEGLIREVAKKTGGKILTDKFAPYKTFVESHAGMSGSFYSDYSMKYWGSRGANWVVAGFPTPDRLADQYRAYSQAVMDDPDYADVDFGHAEFWRSIIAYPFEGGHYIFAEHGIDSHPGDPKWQEVVKRIGSAIPRYGAQRRLVIMGYNRAPREGLPRVTGPYWDVANKIHTRLDPDNLMQPGFVYS